MEARIVKLEESAAATRERFAAMEARMEQFATKADLTTSRPVAARGDLHPAVPAQVTFAYISLT
jgi:hypothetical protein